MTDDSSDTFSSEVLGASPKYTSRQVTDVVGIPMYRARRFWRALGFANVGEDEARFTSADIAALSTLIALVRDGVLDENQALELARGLGRAMSRLADSQTDFTVKLLDSSGLTGTERSTAAQRLVQRYSAEFEELLIYTWRRHLATVVHRLQPQRDPTGRAHVTVGFADLVSFTLLSRQLTEHELAGLVERFESGVADLVIANNGRVIKSLGDEILFTTDQPAWAAEIAIHIAERAQRSDIPGIRVGLEYGPVIRHGGDVFGETVNLASRLTAMAEPNGIMVGPGLAGELRPDRRFQLSVRQPTDVRGVGMIEPAELTRAESPSRR